MKSSNTQIQNNSTKPKQRKYEENYRHKIVIKLLKSSDKQEILKANGKKDMRHVKKRGQGV